MRYLVLLLTTIGALQAAAQLDQLAARHARIIELNAAEDHPAVIKEVELQLKQAQGTPWQDSVYRYTYMLGRAVWKSRDADAGVAAAERIAALVNVHDKYPLHQLDAMDDLARLLYGMGRMKDCARADSTALAFVNAHKEVPLIRRGKARQRLAFDYAQMGDHERGLKFYLDAKAVYERSDTLLALLLGEACNGAGSSFWHLGRTAQGRGTLQDGLVLPGEEHRPEAQLPHGGNAHQHGHTVAGCWRLHPEQGQLFGKHSPLRCRGRYSEGSRTA